MTTSALDDATDERPVAQEPLPPEAESPDDDPRHEEPNPLDEPEADEPPQPIDPGTDQQVGA